MGFISLPLPLSRSSAEKNNTKIPPIRPTVELHSSLAPASGRPARWRGARGDERGKVRQAALVVRLTSLRGLHQAFPGDDEAVGKWTRQRKRKEEEEEEKKLGIAPDHSKSGCTPAQTQDRRHARAEPAAIILPLLAGASQLGICQMRMHPLWPSCSEAAIQIGPRMLHPQPESEKPPSLPVYRQLGNVSQLKPAKTEHPLDPFCHSSF